MDRSHKSGGAWPCGGPDQNALRVADHLLRFSWSRLMPAPKGNKNAVGNKGGGAPSKYQAKYAKLAALACQAGCTDQEVADLIGVSQKTINRWKLQHVEFVTALKSGKAPADERVVQSLYQRALGYDHNGKHYPPDVTACIFWLKNRCPEEWRDRQDQRHTIVQDNRTAAEIFADLRQQMSEMGLDLVPRDDSSFALPPVLPATGLKRRQ